MAASARVMLVGLAFSAILLSAAKIADAETVHVEQYKHPTDEAHRTYNIVYWAGVIDGLVSYNAFIMGQGGEPLFCMPEIALKGDQAEDIMLRWIKKHPTPNIDGMAVSMVLLFGLKETFPCKK